MEYLTGSKGMCITFLLPLIIVGLIVMFNDYTVEAHELNAEIHLLLEDDDDVVIRHKTMFSSLSQTGKEPKAVPLLSLTLFEALEAHPHIDSGTIIASPQEDIQPLTGFDLVRISPPRQ